MDIYINLVVNKKLHVAGLLLLCDFMFFSHRSGLKVTKTREHQLLIFVSAVLRSMSYAQCGEVIGSEETKSTSRDSGYKRK